MFEAFTLREAAVREDEERLRRAVRELGDDQQGDERRAAFYRRYNKALKDPDTYAVLNWLFLTGLHHYYLGRSVRGSVNLLCMLAGAALLFVQPLAGIALIVFVVLLELPALFRSQLIVTDYNNRLGWRILSEQRRPEGGVRRP